MVRRQGVQDYELAEFYVAGLLEGKGAMKSKSPLGNTPENKPRAKAKLTPEMEAVKWKPGQSGNPSGRPKKKLITEMYEEILNDPEHIATIKAATVKALRNGNMAMVLQLKEMADRTEGKVTQPIEASVTMNLAGAIAEGRKRAAMRAGK